MGVVCSVSEDPVTPYCEDPDVQGCPRNETNVPDAKSTIVVQPKCASLLDADDFKLCLGSVTDTELTLALYDGLVYGFSFPSICVL